MAKKKPYRFVLYLLVRAVASVVYVMPRSWVMALGRLLGTAGFLIVSRQSKKALEHLTLVYGAEKTPRQIRSLARKVFENLTMTSLELLQFSKFTPEKVKEIVDYGNSRQVYDEILSRGKGLISVTAHLGNWELLAGAFGVLGYQGAVLARRIYYDPYNRWIVGLREALKVRTIYRDDSSREILRMLRQGQIVGLLPDQDIDSLKGIFVSFFGREAYTPVAPAKLALASGAPIVPNFLVRLPDARYQVRIGNPIYPDLSLDRETAARVMTQQWMEQFEKMIRQHPEQWAWMHNRWKTTPESLRAKNQKEVTSTP